MSVKHCLLLGSALLLSACATQSAIEETGDIASQFCLTNDTPHSEARQLLLSPTLARSLNDAKRRADPFWTDNSELVTTTTTKTLITSETSLQPPMQTPVTTTTQTTVVVPTPICQPGRMFTMNGMRYAEIHHGMSDGSKPGWTDRLVLKRINGKWMIDDILFAPDYRRGMRSTLMQAQ